MSSHLLIDGFWIGYFCLRIACQEINCCHCWLAMTISLCSEQRPCWDKGRSEITRSCLRHSFQTWLMHVLTDGFTTQVFSRIAMRCCSFRTLLHTCRLSKGSCDVSFSPVWYKTFIVFIVRHLATINKITIRMM